VFERVRRRAGYYLRDTATPAGKATSYGLYVLNLVFLGLYVVGTFPAAARYGGLLGTVEFALALVFAVEILLRLDSADDTGAELRSPYTVVDVIAVAPVLLVALLPAGVETEFLRGLYVLRVFRIARQQMAEASFLGYELDRRRLVSVRILTSVVLVFFGTGGVIHAIEAGVNPDIVTFWDAFYYAIIAVTTTGFGNTVPVTVWGELVTALGLLVAVIVIPWQVARARDPSPDLSCDACGLDRHDYDARYCRRCGNSLYASDERE